MVIFCATSSPNVDTSLVRPVVLRQVVLEPTEMLAVVRTGLLMECA